MTSPPPPERADLLGMLARYGDRDPADVGEQLGSLELTWLVAQVEQRYAVVLELSDETFAAMSTVTGALDVLRATLAGTAAGSGVTGSGVAGSGVAGCGGAGGSGDG